MTTVDANSYQGFIIPGIILILMGVILLAIPFLARLIPSVQKLPPILIWVYKSDGFYFVTSPILIIVSLISIAIYLLRARS
jgi:hypothetical protein